MVKILGYINWIVIAALFIIYIVLVSDRLARSGNDPNSRGIGLAMELSIIIVIILLLILNLLPYPITKYLGIALTLLSVVFIYFNPYINPSILDQKRPPVEIKNYDDDVLNELNDTILAGNFEAWVQLLTKNPNYLHDQRTLNMAILACDRNTSQEENRLKCLNYLFDHGANYTEAMDFVFISIAGGENLKLTELLLQKGANANVLPSENSIELPPLFEAINSIYNPEKSTALLLKYGANPNITFDINQDEKDVPILIYAAQKKKWNICKLLLGAGAKLNDIQKSSFKKILETSLKEDGNDKDVIESLYKSI